MKACDHTLHAVAECGRTTGSWVVRRARYGQRVECGVCGRFYGYLASSHNRRGRKRCAQPLLGPPRDDPDPPPP